MAQETKLLSFLSALPEQAVRNVVALMATLGNVAQFAFSTGTDAAQMEHAYQFALNKNSTFHIHDPLHMIATRLARHACPEEVAVQRISNRGSGSMRTHYVALRRPQLQQTLAILARIPNLVSLHMVESLFLRQQQQQHEAPIASMADYESLPEIYHWVRGATKGCKGDLVGLSFSLEHRANAYNETTSRSIMN